MKIQSEARQRVARSLLVTGPGTAFDLSGRLRMTPTGVRKHLDSLCEDGLVVAGSRPAFGRTPDRGRGRPPRIYSITEEGRDAFDQGYQDLALELLRFLVEGQGESGVSQFAQARAKALEDRYSAEVAAGASTNERVEILASAMTRDGFAASLAPGTGPGIQICQHNCPILHVSEEFPGLCRAETEALGRLLGAHVTRLATIARGDGVCTTLVSEVPARDVPAQARRENVPT
ncbi:MAG: transcriptional regulator [Candidatus Nanopelagicales bacterium]|nr:transcriptional regulator [Candidatus Nanopelagicales bacterium]